MGLQRFLCYDFQMRKGIDFTGVMVTFFCHDGEGNYVFHKRSEKCRDEHGRWDFGGGGLKFNEKLLDAVNREVMEEYGTKPKKIEFIGFDELQREHEDSPTHWLAFRYRVLVNKNEVINAEPEKHSELGWYKLDNLPAPLHSAIPKELEEYKDKLT